MTGILHSSAEVVAYSQDQARDSHGRFSGGGGAPTLTQDEAESLCETAFDEADPGSDTADPDGAGGEAIYNYAMEGGGSGVEGPQVNTALRAGVISEDAYVNSVEPIDRLMAGMVTTQDLTVYRGVDAGVMKGMNVGDTLMDPAYVSTTLLKGDPNNDPTARLTMDSVVGAHEYAASAADGGVVLTIPLPAGTHAVGVGGPSAEVLLPRESLFTVSAIDNTGPRPVYTMTLAPQGVVSVPSIKGAPATPSGVKDDPGNPKLHPENFVEKTREDGSTYKSYIGPGSEAWAAGYDPSQPRDPSGRWGDGAKLSDLPTTGWIENEGAHAYVAPVQTDKYPGPVYTIYNVANTFFERGSGAGGRLMQTITRMADNEHATLVTEVVAPKLVAWYGKFGFVPVGEPTTTPLWRQEIVRLPKVTAAGYDPDQPRDTSGEWEGGGEKGSKAEIKQARAFAAAKIAAAPVPTEKQILKGRAALERAKKDPKARAGGDARGKSRDRIASRRNLFNEQGGREKGYVVCHLSGLKLHWTKDPGLNPNQYPVMSRGKIFTAHQGGGYQLPNLLPESLKANQERGEKPIRPENLGP